jgi:hypothetical protein
VPVRFLPELVKGGNFEPNNPLLDSSPGTMSSKDSTDSEDVLDIDKHSLPSCASGGKEGDLFIGELCLINLTADYLPPA